MPRSQRRVLSAALAALVVLALAALGAGSALGPLAEPLPHDPLPVPTLETEERPVPMPSIAPDESARDEPPEPLPAWLGDLVRTVVIGVIVAAAIAAIIHLSRAVKPQRRQRAAAGGDALEIPDVDELAVEETLDDALQRLRSGVDVQDTIVECWRRLESLAADAGVERRPSQTSREFTVEVLASTRSDADALRELASLHTELHYSTHTLGDEHRQRAVACLTRLRDTVGAP